MKFSYVLSGGANAFGKIVCTCEMWGSWMLCECREVLAIGSSSRENQSLDERNKMSAFYEPKPWAEWEQDLSSSGP